MVRLLAFTLNADPALEFCKGLSSDEEPDLWRKDLTGAIEQWIEVGLPDERRPGACGRATGVCNIYGGRAAEIWWEANRKELARQDKLSVHVVDEVTSQALAALTERTMPLVATIQTASCGCPPRTAAASPCGWKTPVISRAARGRPLPAREAGSNGRGGRCQARR